jgi:hypothetical protein
MLVNKQYNENICIVCINVAFANASALQNALNCNIVIEKTEPKGYGKFLTKQPHNINNIPKADHYIFAGSGIMTRIDISSLKGRKTVILSDSHYLQDTEQIDSIIEKENIEVFCMADLWEFCKFEKRMYIHPFLDFNLEIIKSSNFSICHSPYSKINTNQKGSLNIERAVSKLKLTYPLDYICITDNTWEETLKIKSTAHYFIDQLSQGNHYSHLGYKGGVGKSGLEAMLLGCLTFCGGVKVDSDLEPAPFIKVNNENDLYEKMIYYKKNETLAKEIINRQYNWAIENTNAKVIAERILEV